MKSTVEQLSPTRVRINVEVPFEELKPDFDKAYKALAQQIRLPGFRPGKAPAKLLEA
ncbi:trigger factor family protein, partial [Rhodococcus sp. IEGM 69]